jgi:F-type H+-transporting ATPase subunit a
MEEHALLMDFIINPEVVPHYVTYAFLSSILLILLALMIKGSMSLVPTGVQNIVECVAKYMLDLAEETIGHHWGRPFFPLICTIFMYIAACNFMGLIPGFLATHFYGMKVHGVSYIKHFLGPMRNLAALPLMILMFFVETVSHLARPVTLSVRLFGNMIAKHFLLLVLGFLVPWFIPVLVLGLGVLVCVVQALVFALLTTMYLAGAVEEAH